MLCEKGLVRTQDLGYQAERYDHCSTRPVSQGLWSNLNPPVSLCVYIPQAAAL
jgi:hypothetical protein